MALTSLLLADSALCKELDQKMCRGALLILPDCAFKLIITEHPGPFTILEITVAENME